MCFTCKYEVEGTNKRNFLCHLNDTKKICFSRVFDDCEDLRSPLSRDKVADGREASLVHFQVSSSEKKDR